jgi:NLI interacting factor-like phosphatase
LFSYKELGTNKELYLKNMDVLFGDSRVHLASHNTVIVDDSPRKHIMNNPENVILLDSWYNRSNGEKDSFLLDILLPWFQSLHMNRDVGLKSFRKNTKWRIGRQMLCDERGHREYDKLMEVVSGSACVS